MIISTRPDVSGPTPEFRTRPAPRLQPAQAAPVRRGDAVTTGRNPNPGGDGITVATIDLATWLFTYIQGPASNPFFD